MDLETDMLRQAVFDSLGAQGLQALALIQGGGDFLGAPPPSVPLSWAPGGPSFSIMSQPGEQHNGSQEEPMDLETDMLRQAVFDSLGAQGLQALAMVQGGQDFLGAPPPSVPLSLAPGVPSFSGAPPPSVPLGLAPPASVPLGLAPPSLPLVTAPPASLPLVTAPPASVPPVSSLGVTTAASGPSTPRVSAAVSGFPVGLQGGLMKVIVDQQRQLRQVGVRPVTQPAPGFQVFQHQVPQVEGLQVASSPSLRLGAQLAQLSITPGQSEVQVLRANQLVMQANLLQHNREQQRAAAEKKVGKVFAKVNIVQCQFEFCHVTHA